MQQSVSYIDAKFLRVTQAPETDVIGSLASNLRFLRYLEARELNSEIRQGCITCRKIGHAFTSACWL